MIQRPRILFLLLLLSILPTQAIATAVEVPTDYLAPEQALPVAKVRIAEGSPNAEVTISADEMGMDKANNIVVAQGRVEVMQENSILMADKITYYQTHDLVIAEGNVSMLQPGGDVFFAERAELKDGMKQAIIHQFKARFADNSVLVADRAIKVNSSVTDLKKASYTPCNICEGVSPFWQMNAGEARVNDMEERVTYRDAFMEMAGIPMFYTPYLSHPTPDARGKSGLLSPSYATNPYFGALVKMPVYWRMTENQDVVLTPWLTTDEGPLLQWDYHYLRDAGDYQMQGSITNPHKVDGDGNRLGGHEWRGHLFAQGVEQIDEHEQVGFGIERTTDDTYLRRYGFGDQQALFSTAYYEYAHGRNLGLASAIAIQGLRSTDVTSATPLAFPIFQGYYESPPDAHGLKWSIDGNAQALTRDTGVSQRRLSLTPGVSLPMVSEGGQVVTASLQVRQDIYSVSDLALTSTQTYDGTVTRTLPRAALEWRYPLINAMETGSWALEPVMLAILQPEGGNSAKIANEDSHSLELTDTNLLSAERMPGLDLYDEGSRLAYGVRSQFYAPQGATFTGLLGHSYHFSDATPFPNSTRAGDQFSDVIGQAGVDYAPVSFSYRFAMDAQDATFNRNEVNLGFSQPYLTFASSYRSIKNNRYTNDSREGALNATVPLSEEWSLYGGAQRDLELDQMVSANSGIIYKNECFTIMVQGLRMYARDRDITPTTEFTFRVGFKNLGEFGGI